MKKWLSANQFSLMVAATILITAIVCVQSVSLGEKYFGEQGPYTWYNNYVIFRQSFDHLLDGTNLYTAYPAEQWDIYKYTPTFSLFFGFFRVLPDVAGLFAWNLLNALVLTIAVWKLGFEKDRYRWLALGFVLLEIITAMQNSQSNSLIAGLIILAFVHLEKNKIITACLLVVLAVFIKPFALVGFALFLFYPGKVKMLIGSILFIVTLFFLPVILTGFDGLLEQYGNWFEMLQNDHDQSVGISVMGWLKTWFGVDASKSGVLSVGMLLFALPLIRMKLYRTYQFRLLMLASVLIWIVIFNHKAESPTFVIAATGMAIWYFGTERNLWNTIVIILAFVF